MEVEVENPKVGLPRKIGGQEEGVTTGDFWKGSIRSGLLTLSHISEGSVVKICVQLSSPPPSLQSEVATLPLLQPMPPVLCAHLNSSLINSSKLKSWLLQFYFQYLIAYETTSKTAHI